MADAKLLAEARELSELLITSSDFARDLFASIAHELEIPVSITRALCAMEAPAPMSELATKLRCDKSYITAVADQLEEMALVTRVAGADRRTKLLELTPKGAALREKLESRVAALSPAMTALSPDERVVLKNLLARMSSGEQ